MASRRKRSRFLHRKTEPARASVNVERATARPLMRSDKGVPFGHFDGIIDDRSRIDFREDWLGSGVQPIENINGRILRNRTNVFGFWNIGNKKCLTASFGQGARDRLDATTIGIALDHGGAFSLGALC